MKIFKHPLFKSLIIFIFFFSLFFLGHLFRNEFGSSDDPYYHAKHSYLIARSGQLDLVGPWLAFHFFNYAPVDPWWGLHLGTALFIRWFGLFLGVKIFISLLAALIFLTFYLVLSNLKIKYASIWTLLLFFSSSVFVYRLFLERPHLISILFLPPAVLFLMKNKNVWLFFLSLFFALSYHLAFIVILLAVLYLIVEVFTNKQINLKPLIATTSGFLAGVLLHPNSLNYLYVIFIVPGKALFLKFLGVDLNIPNELRMTNFFGFISYSFLTLLPYLLAVTLFFIYRHDGKSRTVKNFLFLSSAFWFAATLLVQRGVELWLPSALLFSAVIFSDFAESQEFGQIKDFLVHRLNLGLAGFSLVVLVVLVIRFNLIVFFRDFYFINTESKSASYQQANAWLKANTKAGTIVFYNNWGMWPLMFFYNDHNRYIHGIDPTFFYEYDKKNFWLWQNISAQGLYCDQPKPCINFSPADQIKLVPPTIRTVFQAKYAVLLNSEPRGLINTLNSLRDSAKVVFKNKDLLIYEIK